VSHIEIMDFILNNVPTTLHVITQRIEVLTIQDLTPRYIKVTYTSHLSLYFS
jgi:hypothetical protein